MYFYLPVPYLPHTSPTAHMVTPRKKCIVVPPRQTGHNHRYNQVPVPVPYTRTTLPYTCIPLKEGPCLPNITSRYLRYGTYGMIAMCRTRGYGTLRRLGSPYTKRRENVCMCVYGMLHVACYFICTYLVGTLMSRFTATTTTEREREGGRKGDAIV